MVSGTVTSSDDNLPLIGVTVLVKGTNLGTVTDIDGNYSIDVEDNATLVFSYTGYESYEVVADGRSTIDVIMQPNISQLSEVVVVGYGTRKRSHNTGAISQVEGADVAAIQANRVDDALACLLYTSPSPRDLSTSRMPSSA